MFSRIHITGASGSGVTTLGVALATHFGCLHHDTDDFFWLPTEPPYQIKRPVDQRLSLLREGLRLSRSWVLSGSLDGWGDPLIPLFDLTIFLYVPAEIRLERIRARERQRYHPDAISPGGELHAKHQAFLEWAAAYDRGDREGRNLRRHEAWLATLPCPVLRIHGDLPLDQVMEQVRERVCQPS